MANAYGDMGGHTGPYWRRQYGITLPGERTGPQLRQINALLAALGQPAQGGPAPPRRAIGVPDPNAAPPPGGWHPIDATGVNHETPQQIASLLTGLLSPAPARPVAALRSAMPLGHLATPAVPYGRPQVTQAPPLVQSLLRAFHPRAYSYAHNQPG